MQGRAPDHDRGQGGDGDRRGLSFEGAERHGSATVRPDWGTNGRRGKGKGRWGTVVLVVLVDQRSVSTCVPPSQMIASREGK
jgi:hypothetical protein